MVAEPRASFIVATFVRREKGAGRCDPIPAAASGLHDPWPPPPLPSGMIGSRRRRNGSRGQRELE